MPIDASIFNNIGRGVKSVGDYDAEYAQAESAKQAQKLNALNLLMGERKLQADDRAIADQAALRQVVGGFGADDVANEQALLRAGRLDEAQKYRKAAGDVAKDRAETGFKAAQTAKLTDEQATAKRHDAFRHISSFASPEDAMASLADSKDVPEKARGPLMQALQKTVGNPQAFRQWQDDVLLKTLSPKDMLDLLRNREKDKIDAANKEMVAGADGAFAPNKPLFAAKNEMPLAQLGESQRHNRTTEGIAGAHLGIARAKLGDSRAAAAAATAESAGGGGAVLGAPVPAVLPWANQSNPKDANKVKAKELERGGKEIEKDADASRAADDIANAAKRFKALNERVKTGGLMDKTPPTRWVQGMGEDYSAMEALTAKLAPGMRPPGAGATSDFDARQYERATVGVDKPKATNANIADGLIAGAQQSKDYADFRQSYLEQNGTLQGADRFWKDYANANPIFDQAKPDSFALNKERKSWKDHFAQPKAGAAAAPPVPASANPGAPKPAGGPTVSNW